jgi:hypothetical protein
MKISQKNVQILRMNDSKRRLKCSDQQIAWPAVTFKKMFSSPPGGVVSQKIMLKIVSVKITRKSIFIGSN